MLEEHYIQVKSELHKRIPPLYNEHIFTSISLEQNPEHIRIFIGLADKRAEYEFNKKISSLIEILNEVAEKYNLNMV